MFLVRNLRRGRVMIVGTYGRTTWSAAIRCSFGWPRWAAPRTSERMDLRPLDAGEQRQQLAGILGRRVDREFATRIHVRSGGNPFYAEELLAGELASPTAARAPLPASLREILVGRIAELSDPARSVLRVASVAGPRTDDGLLATVTGMPPAELDEALREVVGRHVLAVDERTGTYRFRHALLAEAAAADLLRRAATAARGRRPLADRSFATGRQWPAGTAGDLALHWSAADVPPGPSRRRSVPRGTRSASTPMPTRSGSSSGPSRSGTASDAAERSSGDHIDLLRDAADAAELGGEPERAVALATQALTDIDESADPVRAGLIHARLGYYRWLIGERHALLEETQRAAELIPADPRPWNAPGSSAASRRARRPVGIGIAPLAERWHAPGGRLA